MTPPVFVMPTEVYLVTFTMLDPRRRTWCEWSQLEREICLTLADVEGHISEIMSLNAAVAFRVLHATEIGVIDATEDVLRAMAAKWADEYLPHQAQPLPAYLAKHLPSYAEAAE
jgi:hypothetical protein